MARPIQIGDQVRTLDRQETGTVMEIRTYAGMGDKLLVQLDSPHEGTVLLAVELWQQIKKADCKKFIT
jgi:hypothetical protein